MNHRLVEIRKTLGLTQQKLADLVGTHQRNIGYLETEPGRLDLNWIEKISKALKIHPAALFMEPTYLPNESESILLTAYRQADEATKVAVNRVLDIPYTEAGKVEAVVVTDKEEREVLDAYRKLDRDNRQTLVHLMRGLVSNLR